MRWDRAALMVAAAVALAAGIWISVLLPREPTLTVTFLDVGEGLNAVVRSPSGATMVFDCGTSTWRNPEVVGEKVTASYLQSQGVDIIDVAVLSHPHADHVSGYAGLLNLKPTRLVLDTGAAHPSPHYKRFLAAVKRCGATYRVAHRGQTIDLGGGALAQVLSPGPEHAHEDLNNRSVVLRITYRSVAILLAADAGVEAEACMLEAGLPLRSQVLQVGHHGSDDSTSPEWLAAVAPGLAIISCGRSNSYGHPSSEVVSRLRSAGARVYRTDHDGAVTITTNGVVVRARSMRPTP